LGSLLNAYLPVQWRIKENGLRDYALSCVPDPQDPSENERLRDIAEAEITRYFLAHDVDQLLGPGRAEAGAALRRRIQEAADQARLGVEVVFVGMSGLHPPAEGEVASKFHEPVLAQQERQIMLEEARQYRTQVLTEAAGSMDQAERLLAGIRDAREAGLTPEVLGLLQSSGGQVARKISEARAFRWTYENAARAEAERFSKELLAQAQAPRVYRQRRYLEVLSEGLANARKYLLIANRDRLTIRLDLKDTDVDLPKVDLTK
jgi:regulator of protease activity HflC (stomatin/prohibitin superfamily)